MLSPNPLFQTKTNSYLTGNFGTGSFVKGNSRYMINKIVVEKPRNATMRNKLIIKITIIVVIFYSWSKKEVIDKLSGEILQSQWDEVRRRKGARKVL